MKIYIMRHGTTVWNEKRITKGHSNNRLSKSGIQLVNKTSLSFKEKIFDVIYTSPLMRTIQTANIMNKYHKVKVIKDERLVDIDQGIFTGRQINSISKEELILKNARSKKYGMESYEQVHNRLDNFLKELLKENRYKSILIITHSCCVSMLIEILGKNSNNHHDVEYFCDIKNAEIKEFMVK